MKICDNEALSVGILKRIPAIWNGYSLGCRGGDGGWGDRPKPKDPNTVLLS